MSKQHVHLQRCNPTAGLKLYGEDAEYEKIADEIDDVPGVVGHGLMLGLATAAIVASDKGPQVIELKHTE